MERRAGRSGREESGEEGVSSASPMLCWHKFDSSD